MHQIIFICGNKRKIGGNMDSRFLADLYLQLIVHIDGLHDHPQLMISIFSLSQNIQSQIDLGQRS